MGSQRRTPRLPGHATPMIDPDMAKVVVYDTAGKIRPDRGKWHYHMAPEISMVLRRRRGKRLVRALLSASIKWSRGLICCFILTLMAWMPSGFCVHGPPEFVIARRRIVPNELLWFVCGSCCMHCLNIFLSWFAPRSGRAPFFLLL